MKHKLACAIFAPLLLASSLTSAADAQSTSSASPEVVTEEAKDGYVYKFDDDPLGASPETARGERIHVRRGAVRTLLIRPRTHFIRELFKSAENF